MSMLRHWKTMLGLLVVFVAGLVIGAALTAGMVRREVRARRDSATWAPRTMKWFHDELHVTPEQESQIRPIVDRAVGQMKSLRDESEDHWRSIVGSMLTEAAPILTQEQRADLQEIVQRGEHKPAWMAPGK
ncbi:MAG TPA: hypothetical protein VG713_09560 [Pirellulales bacterium]|nr:hypothetical protein [Pirellulales bacterium]